MPRGSVCTHIRQYKSISTQTSGVSGANRNAHLKKKKTLPAEQASSHLMLALIYKRYTGVLSSDEAMLFAAPTWNFLVPSFGNLSTELQERIQFGRAYYCYCACAKLNALLLTEATGELSRGMRTPPSVCQENCDFLWLGDKASVFLVCFLYIVFSQIELNSSLIIQVELVQHYLFPPLLSLPTGNYSSCAKLDEVIYITKDQIK